MEEDAEAVAGADAEEGRESKGDAEVTMEEELAEEEPQKGGGGKGADGGAHVAGCASNTDPGGGGEVEVPGTGGLQEGEKGNGGSYSARQKATGGMGRGARSASTGDGVYESARGYGERRVAQEAGRGGGHVGHRGGGGAVLQLQHREDLGTGWGAERAVQIRPDRAVWLEPGWKGRYRVAGGGRRWWGWHMTWRADQVEGVPVRNEWGGELPGGGQGASSVRAQFTRAALLPAPTTQGHRGQGLVYTFGEEMTLKAAEAIKMVLDEGTACMANRTYHVHPHTGDTWQYAFPGYDGMESIVPLPECERQGAEISAPARVAEE